MKPRPGEREVLLRIRDAAARYRPGTIRLLLVADAPPTDPSRHFYSETGTGPLFEGVCEVVFEEPPRAGEKPAYLKELRRRGVYEIEMRPDPSAAGMPLRELVTWLAIRCEDLAPLGVVLIGPALHRAAFRALKAAGLHVVDQKVAEPGGPEFRRDLRKAIVKADLERIIRPMPKPRRAREERA